LVIAAYKEEAWILKRLQNAIEQDYPRDGLEILVGCDGHEDLTGDLAEAFHDDRVRVVVFPARRGKASVLNDLVPMATGEVLVFTDANTLFERSAIKNLARHFDDATVGGVVGRLVLVDPEWGSNADGMYWKFENFLKGCEGKLGAVLGANGGIYAIRRELFRPIPANTILDDFLIGMRIHETGRRLLYDKQALAFEETPTTVGAEFKRRSRIGAGGYQSLGQLSGLLWPPRGWLAFAFWSHKVLRWACPVALASALVCNALLVRSSPLYVGMMAAQGGLYLLALATPRFDRLPGVWKVLRLPEMFVQMNLALAVGFVRFARGIRGGTWTRTERTDVEGRDVTKLGNATNGDPDETPLLVESRS
jgi:glycosyltransferase involved in cell wall biosynthesis